MNKLSGNRILITGGTGSLGTALVRRLLEREVDSPACVTVFSRDELKQSQLRAQFPDDRLRFVIGDVRDYRAVELVLRSHDVVIEAAAMKRIEVCQRFPSEAIKTNCLGTINIVEAIREHNLPVTVLGVGSDKGCYPVNTYGKTKSLQEDILLAANNDSLQRFVAVRYGNVMASRGSVILIFLEQIKEGKPLTIRDPNMTRFLISLDQAVDTILAAYAFAKGGEVYVPMVPSATVGDIADVLIDGREIEKVYTGAIPGEKMHELLITEDELSKVILRDNYFVVTPEVQKKAGLLKEYNSKNHLLDKVRLKELFSGIGVVELAK